jgi:hypothetical protein
MTKAANTALKSRTKADAKLAAWQTANANAAYDARESTDESIASANVAAGDVWDARAATNQWAANTWAADAAYAGAYAAPYAYNGAYGYGAPAWG